MEIAKTLDWHRPLFWAVVLPIHSLPNVMGLIGNFLLGPSLLVSLITLPLLQIDELNKSTFIFDSFFLQQEIAEELPKKLLAQEN